MILSPCIEWIFAAEHPEFADRIRAAKQAGLEAVEFHLWRAKPLDAVEQALAETGVRLTSLVVDPRVHLVNPAAREAIVSAVRETLPVAQRLGCPAIVVASGPLMPDATVAQQHDTLVGHMQAVAPYAEDAGITVLLEPVNTTVDHPGMYLDTTPKGLDAVEAVASPRVRLLWDLYHSAAMGEDAAAVIGDRMHLVAHVQAADHPGRHEPGSGAIDWPARIALLKAKGYQGAIGLEYRPTGDSLASLQRARRSLGIVA
ncbi:MAG: hypothetical protein RL684_2948 [Pseudomonadota bacterium]|jgi:hydroxypyruvate isomerase